MMTKFILNRYVDLFIAREPYSAKFIADLGVNHCVTTADAAFLIKPTLSTIKNSGLTSNSIIGFAPAMLTNTLTQKEITTYADAHAKCIDELINDYSCKIILLPSSADDIAMCKLILSRAVNKKGVELVITDELDFYEPCIKRLDLLITTRMHPSILAARNHVPFAAIIYDHKQLGVLKQLGLKNSIPIRETTYTSLKSLIVGTAQNFRVIQETITTNLPLIQCTSIATIQASLHSYQKGPTMCFQQS
jgi:polysaccharide pyruvyl transferase WcaK-like protein